ncbi:DNA cytosine methyltransferase [Pandoraea anhela]|uniref:Cytosine-specific methyltransferase n=1 Tax=Pandoraea anhela TaxID=2508295 RepID=A0A5E4YL50_9BURK|nr:DNA cytosine methyltransferase [Pandoraea anhela]VVE49459.1 DNA (cytosine-5-)-methyltransferase [Pandoraea anhela]
MSKRKAETPSVASFFSGCGGLDIGFETAGFDIRHAFDVDHDALLTYNSNLRNVAQHLDLSTNTPCVGPIDVLLAGAPCQGFSTAGKRNTNDPRNQLLLRIPELVEANSPRVVVVENVPGVRSGIMNDYWAALEGRLRAQDYQVKTEELSANEVGGAQLRKRVFMICWRGNAADPSIPRSAAAKSLGEVLLDIDPQAPNHDLTDSVLDKKTLAIARKIKPGQKLSNVRSGPRSVHTWLIPQVFGETSDIEKQILQSLIGLRRQIRRRENGDADPVEIKILEKMFGKSQARNAIRTLVDKDYLERHEVDYVDLKHTFNGLYRRLTLDAPSYTVDTRFCSPRHFLHPSANRGFTAREAARIQGFPDNFTFIGKKTSVHRMIGNAVSPVVSRALASLVKDLLR